MLHLKRSSIFSSHRPDAESAVVSDEPWSEADFVKAGADALFRKLVSSPAGLSEAEAKRRLKQFGPNEPARKRRRGPIVQLLSKFTNPLVLVLIIIGSFSFAIGERVSVIPIAAMIILSVTIAFVQEYRSGREAERLIALVRTTASVTRGGHDKEVDTRTLVPGDLVHLAAGDIVPADIRIVHCKDLSVNQSALTGESFPVDKCDTVGSLHTTADYGAGNLVYLGTSVVSGSADGLVIKTGAATQFGAIAGQLSEARPETSFDRGIRGFSMLMIKAMMVMVLFIFVAVVLTKGTFLEAILFSLAVAVGLTPELLPTMVAVNLSKGAAAMSRRKVIVKHLNSIQNFGAMDILCTDKTGTLTLDNVVLIKHCDVAGREDESVLGMAQLNAHFETGLKNLLDRAVLKHAAVDVGRYRKIDEIPFDFSRRIMSVVVEGEGKRQLIAKGAPEELFQRCNRFEQDGKVAPIDDLHLPTLRQEFESLNGEGFRVLAVGYREITDDQHTFNKDDEKDLVLKGYVAFLDPPKPSAKKALDSLRELGVLVKVLSGDNAIVTSKICFEVGLASEGDIAVTGDEVEQMDDAALAETVEKHDVFARLSPMQKERVIKMIQKNGHTVGYLGDGINDAASLKVSDVGISVNNAVDIAKESAELILLEKDLSVLRDGVIEGRRTFANIIKFVRMGSSSNFGNMVSLTGASLFLPFVPMAPIQVLLNNFLYDLSQIAIPTDNVDEDDVRKPRGWNVASIKRFMIIIGPVSSIFDFLTFGVALFLFHAPVGLFRTFWFIESIFTQTLIIHVIRTAKRPFIESRASRYLTAGSIIVLILALALVNSPFAGALGFVRPPLAWYPMLAALVICYLFMTQAVKKWFIRKYGYG
ncbi:MAG: magnesium-translocating P-type ATPase [Patescibacteria group bacterium]|nr:magnesium-translocating P-type ATPase [Patescibacteria group bacterium]